MNESCIEMLLTTARTDWGDIKGIFRKEGQCWACLYEAFFRCHKEHPEWFCNKTTKRVNLRYKEKVKKYLLNTAKVPVQVRNIAVCIDEDEDIYKPEEIGICGRHMAEILHRFEEFKNAL